MKSSILLGTFVLTIAYSLIVHGQQQTCTCGNLGSGTNPCTCTETVVKASKLPKPTFYVSPEEINDAASARNGLTISSDASQSGCSQTASNTQTVSNPNPGLYNNGNYNGYVSGGSTDTVSVNSGSFDSRTGTVSNSFTDAGSISYSNAAGTVTYTSTSSNSNSNADASTSSNYDSVTYSNANNNPTISTGSLNSYVPPVLSNFDSVTYNSNNNPSVNSYANPVLAIDNSGSRDSGCGCSGKQITSESSIDAGESPVDSNVNIVPSFSPVGDLCYPLPIDSRSGRLIEKTKVTPAYPGKVLCNECNPLEPYEICINTRNGQTRMIGTTQSQSDSLINTGGPFSRLFGSRSFVNGNYEATNGPVSNGGSNLGVFTTGTGTVDASTRFSRLGKFSSSGSVSSNFATFGDSNSGGVFNRAPSLLYPGLNGERQYGRINAGSSSCFDDDDTDDDQVNYSSPELPADAVSLTLAYKNLRAPNVIYRQGKQFVPEDKLSFGHRTVPNDANIETRKILDIPEERLVTVEKPVVELKLAPPRTVVIGSYDEREEAKLAELEAIERESITQEESVDGFTDGLLTYKDLGYAPVGSTFANSRSYNGIINGEINENVEEPCGPLGPPVPDYIPGSVQTIQQALPSDDYANSPLVENPLKTCPN